MGGGKPPVNVKGTSAAILVQMFTQSQLVSWRRVGESSTSRPPPHYPCTSLNFEGGVELCSQAEAMCVFVFVCMCVRERFAVSQ